MSGRCSRTYSRKKAAPPPLSQFDKLVTADSGNSTRPSVTKTAGHIGKWGITSFTSLRNINGGFGKDDNNKRSYPDDSPPSSLGDDAYAYDGAAANGASLQVRPPVATFSKPRKFFKSRNAESVSEPSRVPAAVPEKSRGKVSEGLSSVKSPSLSSTLETPESSQSPLKDNSSSKVLADASEKLSLTKSNNSETVLTSSKSGSSGIKLKIFKSRNVASCSQETYSSTVELPSDDSRANSASTSNASSPSTKDFSEGNPDSSEEFGGCSSPQPEYKIPKINVANTSAAEITLRAPEKADNPNRTHDSSYDSSFEFTGLVDQRTGLPIDVCMDDSDYSFSGNQNKCESLPASNDNVAGSMKKTYGSKVSKSCELNRYLSKNMVPSVSDIDTQQAQLNESLCDGSLNDDFDLPVFGVGSSDFNVSEKVPSIDRGISPGVSSTGGGESDNIDLFSTDFDENEIEDRTNIDCTNINDVVIKETNVVATEEDDMFSTQGSFDTFRRSHSTKSESEVSTGKPDQPPPLTKKRSIFKSRDADRDAKKQRATYKHKWHDQEDKEEGTKEATQSLPSSQSISSSASPFEDFDFDQVPSTLKRVQTWPTTSSNSFDDESEMQVATSVKCAKGAKQYYTVVKNVKRTHQLQESGEFQEFNDDVEYFLDALRPTVPVSTRCLAALNLAQKCMVPAFRMHLRAHGTVIKFFTSLSDAHTDHRLAICAATVMFTLSQDRLNMDLDRDSLELMLNLLESDVESTTVLSPADTALVEQNKKKIRELCCDMQKKGHAKHLNLDNITAGHLAMETLLSLTSKRAGEWFKEELRELGGVEHLIRTITQCTQFFTPDLEKWTHPLLEKLTKVDRCLKVLENVTHQNVANQEYLLTHQNGIFPEKLVSLYRLCHIEVPLYPPSESQKQKTTIGGASTGQLLVQALLTTVKVLINLTHNAGKEALGSKLLGRQQDVYDITLHCLLIMPRYLTHDNRFELLILACSLLLNLVEHSKNNRIILMKMKAPDFLDDDDNDIFKKTPFEKKGAMQALVELFYRCEASARQQEAHTDDIIDHDLTQKKENEEEKKDDEIEETVARLLQKAGHHMEDTLIAAYTALLTGYCIMDDEDREAEIRAMLPDSKFSLMVSVLKKFLRFMDLTATTSLLRSLKPTERVVKYMEKLDAIPEEEAVVEKKQEEEESEVYAFGF